MNSVLILLPLLETAFLLNFSTRRFSVLSTNSTKSSVAVYNTIIYLGYRKQSSNEDQNQAVIANDSLTMQNILILYSQGSTNLRFLHFDTLQQSSFHFHQLSNSGGISNIQILNRDSIEVILYDYMNNIYIFNYSEWKVSGSDEVRIYPINRYPLLPFQHLTNFHSTFNIHNNIISTDQSAYYHSLQFNNRENNIDMLLLSRIRNQIVKNSEQQNQFDHYNNAISSNSIYLFDSRMIYYQNNELLVNIIVVQLYNTKFHEYYLEIINPLTNTMKVLKIPSLPFQSSNQNTMNDSFLRFLDPNDPNKKMTSISKNSSLNYNNYNANNNSDFNDSKKFDYSKYNRKNENIDDIWVIDLYNGNFCTIQAPSPSSSTCGLVRTFEIFENKLSQSLSDWEKMLGTSDSPIHSNLEISWDGKKQSEGPKAGEKPDGLEHHGGSRFQGGTGGVDTPGLGGKGGSHRVKSNHPLYKITDEEKKKISTSVKEKQIEISRKLRQEKLKEIQMSEYSAEQYERYLNAVKLQINQLRVIMESVKAKQKERIWVKNKQAGELDDMKLVDGLVGEKSVYKHRGEVPPSSFSFQNLPKRIRFVMDISASMYRFNDQDRRLDRLLEVVCMIMESFHKFEYKYQYSIVGHSGDGPEIPLVSYSNPPSTPHERLKIIQNMHAHTEYCSSGDSTVEALKLAIKEVVHEEADDYFVILVSDANLRRYNISTESIATLMKANEKVNSFAIFIASPLEEAEEITRQLPRGKSFVCLDTSSLPSIFKQIFSSNLLNE